MNNVAANRALTPEEITDLTDALRSHLRLNNCSCALQAEADATDLLRYACDMVEDGENVGQVLEELSFMEMEICDGYALENIGECLVEFIGKINRGKKKDWRENNYLYSSSRGGSSTVQVPGQSSSSAAVENAPQDHQQQDEPGEDPYNVEKDVIRGDSSGSARTLSTVCTAASRSSALSSTSRISTPTAAQPCHENYPVESENHVPLDFGAKAAASKNASELENLKKMRRSLKDRMSMYDENGQIIKNSNRENDDGPEGDAKAGEKSADEMRRQELMAVMNDRSLSKAERAARMDEVRAKYGVEATTPPARSSTAPAYIENSNCGQSMSSGSDLDESGRNSYQRGASAGGNSYRSGSIPSTIGGFDLSAKSAADKHKREMEAIFGGRGARRGGLKAKMGGMYDANGNIVKKNQDGDDRAEEASKEKTQDQLRRDELMAVMKDKTLSKEEKAKKMDEIRVKYDGISGGGGSKDPRKIVRRASSGSQHSANIPRRLSNASLHSVGSIGSSLHRRRCGSRSPSPEPVGGVNLSAKSAAEKHRREMEALFGGGGVNNSMKGNKLSYEQNLLNDRASLKKDRLKGTVVDIPVGRSSNMDANVTDESSQRPTTYSNADDDEQQMNVRSPSANKQLETPSLDQLRRAELQKVMRDRSLNKDERSAKMDEIRDKYAVMAKEQGGGLAREQLKGSNEENCMNIDLSAKGYAEKPARELESTNIRGLKERKAQYDKEPTIADGNRYDKDSDYKNRNTLRAHMQHRTKTAVNVDPTSFAVAENGMYGVFKDKKKSIRSEYGGRF